MTSHRISRREILALVLAAFPMWSAAQSIDPKAFEIQVKNGARLVNGLKYLNQDSDGLWQKRRKFVYEIKYDVIKSESALRPLIGTLQVTVVSKFGAKQPTRANAEAEHDVEEAPLDPEGKNTSAFEYDLKFVPSDAGWSFHEGKARRMPISHMRFDWFDLSAEYIRGEHGDVVRAFETQVLLRQKPQPRVGAKPKRNT